MPTFAKLASDGLLESIINDMLVHFDVDTDYKLDSKNKAAIHVQRVADIRKNSMEQKKFKSVDETMKQAINTITLLKD